MNELTLKWTEAGQSRTQTLNDQQTYRVGRDPTRCDIVLSHPTVSGLHIEIFFDQANHNFYLRNLRETNPPIINNQSLITGEVILNVGNNIQLGQQQLEIIAVAFEQFSIAPTRLFSPDELTQISIPKANVNLNPVQYGLKCPKCDRVSSYQQLNVGCPWCGTSLAAAVSVVLSTQ
ncbi:MAG TPA: FHA domain-containing protein [Planktothrix sp. UBA8407]|nr:FHA domain-containing protein [Planktothrix sp. UBA8407]HBK23327.1 FHA domain-containing protein [Planktothrix sp. UBA10369]